MLGNKVSRYESRPEDAERPCATAADAEHSGDGRQGQLVHRAGDGPTHLVLVGVLDRQPPQGHGLLVGRGVCLVGAHQLCCDLGEVVTVGRAGEPEGILDEACLCLDVESRQGHRHVVAVTPQFVHRHLEGPWRGFAGDSAERHPVDSGLFDVDGVEPGGHVGAEVGGRSDFVEQLGGDCSHRYLSTGSIVLADHRRAIGRHVCPRETGAFHAVNLGEERVVATRGLGAAFDDVPCNHRACQRVPVVAGPAVVPCSRPAHDGCVGCAPGDDDVCATLEGLDDAPAAQVGVGADEP
ncbi:MAG: hypothetical protein MAG471_00091 [Acidimicrobiaceae bacterium]|nr:hypothetical protein [Acidimicrobiaceae bacterium]